MVLAALAAACVGCKKDSDTPKDPLLSYAERANFSVVGKIYTRYCTEDTDVPYYAVLHFVNADSMKTYDTDRADGQVGKYNNIEYFTYYLSYPYIFNGSLRDTLYTFTQDSTIMKGKFGGLLHLVY